MSGFVSPDWTSPLDLVLELRRIPESARQKGMFLQAMVAEAKRRGAALPSARDRYVLFQDYPLREHAQLLAEFSAQFHPELPLRQGLRRLGRAAYAALTESTVGKVIWASATDPAGAVEAIVKAYEISIHGCSAKVVERTRTSARVRLERIHYFLDCHHVGCFEGGLRAAGVEGDVKIRLESYSSGELLCSW